LTDKPSLIDEATDGARTLFGRLGEFFHIFDLSFLVAGATTFGAIMALYHRLRFSDTFPLSGWMAGFALVIACYVCGLISFSLGRTLNALLFRRRALDRLKVVLTAQRLRGALIEQLSQTQNPDFPVWRLYARLWQVMADKYPRSRAYGHLSRYWAMAATYDGVAASLLLWIVVLIPVEQLGPPFLSFSLSLIAISALAMASVLCFWQGAKFYEFQVEDLVAALAVMGSSID
jgi:hypothetical protein